MLLKKLLLAAAISGVLPSAAFATSITLTGTVESIKPVPTIKVLTEGDLVAFVKSLTLQIESSSPGCRLVSSQLVATTESKLGELVCLIEWTDVGAGMSKSGMDLLGTPLETGDVEHKYVLSYFSGSAHEKITVAEGSIITNVLAPIAPSIKEIKSNVGQDNVSGYKNITYNKQHATKNIVIELEPRNYNQKVEVKLDQGDVRSCDVPENTTSCNLTMDLSVGLEIYEDIVGDVSKEIDLNSANNYYAKGLLQSQFTFAWDYRPPVIEDIIFNTSTSKENLTTTINNSSFVIKPGEGVVIVASPHTDKAGDWWKPKIGTLNFTPVNSGNEVEPKKIVDGHLLFSGRELSWEGEYDVNTSEKHDFVGDKLVYSISMDGVPDGEYSIASHIIDPNNNESKSSLGNEILLRDEPQIKVFGNYAELADAQPIYFVEHMLVAAYNNFVSGVSVDSVTIDGINVAMSSGEDDSVKYLSSEGLSLSPNSTYQMIVNVTDKKGTKVSHVQDVIYAPVAAELLGAQAPQYRDITEFTLYLNQTSGEKCSQAANDDIASIYGTRYYFTCTMEWYETPEGMHVDELTLGHQLHGVMRGKGSRVIGYRLAFHDGEGNKIIVKDELVSFDLLIPQLPEISAIGHVPLSQDKMAIEYTGGRFAYASVLSSPAGVEMTMKPTEGADGSEDYYFWRERRSRRNANALQKGSARLYTDPGELWSIRTMMLEAHYKVAPGYSTEKVVDVVFVPPKKTQSFARIDDKTALTTEELKIAARVGVFQRRAGSFDYKKETYGEWKLTLEKQVSRREFEEIGTPIIYDGSEEEVYFTLDGKDWLGSNRFCIRADVVSPVEGYEQMSRSRCVRMSVFKGEGVEGGIYTRKLIDRAPFDMAARYKFDEKADQKSSDKILWQISSDEGVTWQEYKGKRDYNSSVVYSFEESGRWHVRAQATNKFTGTVTYTKELEVVAYDVPKIEIQGPRSVFTGEHVELELYDEITQSLADGDVEWSLDGGSTWDVGGNTLSIDSSQINVFKIKVRMRYNDILVDSDNSWDEDTHYVKIQAPRKPSISVSGPREAEVGSTIDLSVNYRDKGRQVIFEWLMPDGTTSSDMNINHLIADSADMRNVETRMFKVNAWLDGFKTETTTQRYIKVKVWKYNMPEASIRFNTSVKYTPAFIRAKIGLDRVFAPGVDFTYELKSNMEDVEIIRQDGNVFELKLLSPRTYPLEFSIKDNRGNENSIIGFFESLETIPLEVDINVRAFSNDSMREPLTTYLQAMRVLPHKRDYISKYEWYLDGKLLNTAEGDESPTYWNIEDLEAGAHEVILKASTDFGQVAEAKLTLNVIDNIKPTCSIVFKQDSSALNFSSTCRDEDGSIKRYEWYLGDSMVSINDRMSYFKYPHLTETNSVVVTLRVYDDSFEFTEYKDTYTVNH
ncbi:MAG: hypothetical protein ACI936_000450 [Paraglaciecola sp.]|jgi:hypothetical protein